jgi:hypothetical protein
MINSFYPHVYNLVCTVPESWKQILRNLNISNVAVTDEMEERGERPTKNFRERKLDMKRVEDEIREKKDA